MASRLSVIAAASALLLTTACATTSSRLTPPREVTITLEAAAVAEAKTDGRKWDDPAWFASVAMAGAAALGVDGGLTIGPFLALLSPLEAPDPVGTAVLSYRGGSATHTLRARENTRAPRYAVSWERVPLTPEVRLRVELRDDDVFESDHIGLAEVGYDELRAALDSRGVKRVDVREQTDGQLLNLGVSVRRAESVSDIATASR